MMKVLLHPRDGETVGRAQVRAWRVHQEVRLSAGGPRDLRAVLCKERKNRSTPKRRDPSLYGCVPALRGRGCQQRSRDGRVRPAPRSFSSPEGPAAGIIACVRPAAAAVGNQETHGTHETQARPNAHGTCPNGLMERLLLSPSSPCEGPSYPDGPPARGAWSSDRVVRCGRLYTFTRLDGPDKGLFLPQAINAKGLIVGEHTPAQAPLEGLPARAVLRDAEGRFTIIEPPGGRFTGLNGINARGQIVGSAVDAKWMFGFVREPDGRFVRLEGMVQKRPFAGNTWAFSADSDRSRLGRAYSRPWLPGRSFRSARTACTPGVPASEHGVDLSATPRDSSRLDWGLHSAGIGGGSGRTGATSSSRSRVAVVGRNRPVVGC